MNINHKDRFGQTPLHLACSLNKPVNFIQLLIEAGADVNSKDKYKQPPLFLAVDSKKLDVVKLLLKNKAKVNEKCGRGQRTALHEACSDGSVEIAKMLIQAGADANVVDKDKRTPIYQTRKPEIKKYCLKLEQNKEDNRNKRRIYYNENSFIY